MYENNRGNYPFIVLITGEEIKFVDEVLFLNGNIVSMNKSYCTFATNAKTTVPFSHEKRSTQFKVLYYENGVGGKLPFNTTASENKQKNVKRKSSRKKCNAADPFIKRFIPNTHTHTRFSCEQKKLHEIEWECTWIWFNAR